MFLLITTNSTSRLLNLVGRCRLLKKSSTHWAEVVIFVQLICPLDFFRYPWTRTATTTLHLAPTFGSFKWLRMPMGLTGSPNTFQSLMEHVLTGLTWKTCVPYLDNSIIFSTTPEEHLSRLRQVFQRFQQANLKINTLNCAFFQTKVQFLEHVVGKDGLQVDPEKINSVRKFPTPANQTHVKSFLRLASYYRRYVQGFADIARPLHKASETSSEF